MILAARLTCIVGLILAVALIFSIVMARAGGDDRQCPSDDVSCHCAEQTLQDGEAAETPQQKTDYDRCMVVQPRINLCDKDFRAGKLQPGDEIGACYAKATNNTCEGGDLDGSRMQVCTDWIGSHPKPKPVAFKPWQRIWQCNDIRVTETGIRPGVINYDLAGTIWGGSQFTYDLNREKIYFNGRACLPVR